MSSRRQARRLVLAGVLALVLAALSGCASQSSLQDGIRAVGTATLVDTYWKLVRVDTAEIVAATGREETHFILGPDHRVTGFGGCNTFSGAWRDKAGKVSIGPLSATKMACPDLELERKLLGALEGDIRIWIAGTTLSLTGADGTEFVFVARYAR